MLQEEIDGANAAYARAVPPGATPIASSALNYQGFYGLAYEENGVVLVAFEGTQSTPDSYGLGTLAADIQIFLGDTPQAFNDAINFTLDVQSLAGSTPIYITGHSLGGAEAEAVALFASNPSDDLSIAGGVTFGAPGLPGYYGATGLGNLTDYVDYGDPVGNYAHDGELADFALTGNHFGTVDDVGPPLDAVITLVNFLSDNTNDLFQFHALSHYAADLGLTIDDSATAANVAHERAALADQIHADAMAHPIVVGDAPIPHFDIGAAHAHHFLV
jgi:hypothetical protein